MSVGHETVIYLAIALPCFLVAALMVWWARPVNGELSPRLRRRGMETLVGGIASMMAIVGLGLTFGGILLALK